MFQQNPMKLLEQEKLFQVPTLRFTPTAWAKALFMRDRGPTEVGGFGLSAPDDPLLVCDWLLPQQVCTSVHCEFDGSALNKFIEHQFDCGILPERCNHIWIHTHPPGFGALPSSVDEETFASVFGQRSWSVMFILGAKPDAVYARLRAQLLGGVVVFPLPVAIDYSVSFAAGDRTSWTTEYACCVRQPPPPVKVEVKNSSTTKPGPVVPVISSGRKEKRGKSKLSPELSRLMNDPKYEPWRQELEDMIRQNREPAPLNDNSIEDFLEYDRQEWWDEFHEEFPAVRQQPEASI